MGFHSCFYWGAERAALQVKRGQSAFKKTGTWNFHSRHLSPNTKPTFQMFEDRIWNVKIGLHVKGSRITRRLRLKRTKSKQLSMMSEKYLAPSPQNNSTPFLTVCESLVQVDVLFLTSAGVWNMAAGCRQVCVHSVPCSPVIPVQGTLKTWYEPTAVTSNTPRNHLVLKGPAAAPTPHANCQRCVSPQLEPLGRKFFLVLISDLI